MRIWYFYRKLKYTLTAINSCYGNNGHATNSLVEARAFRRQTIYLEVYTYKCFYNNEITISNSYTFRLYMNVL